MPRAPYAAVLAIAGLLLSSTAQATPRLRLSVHTEPIQGFAHTGNIAGAGASISMLLSIESSEYGGHPPPLVGLSLRLPPGMTWNARGFPTCPDFSQGLLIGPRGCARGAEMKPESKATVEVAFGAQTVSEQVKVDSKYRSNGGLILELSGRNPVLLEIGTHGTVQPGNRGTGALIALAVPLVETVPGGVDASFTSFGFRLGSGLRPTAKTRRFSLHAPRRCPHGFLRFSVEARFAAVSGLPAQSSASTYRAPCPIGAKRR